MEKTMPNRKRVIIVGAVGMDYHVFNTYFRDNPEYEVVAFTMAKEQNLGTTGGLRPYPASLCGKLYPSGIPTRYEHELPSLIRELKAEEVVFAYSDVSHVYLMNLASQVLVAGANWRLISPRFLQIQAHKPVAAVCAVRTGCGKSQTSRRVYEILKSKGLKVVAIREPMPYGDLEKQVWQRFATYKDLDDQQATIEEREEYEPYIDCGMVIYAGCDYAEILKHAEAEADVIVWDGGNNEISFYKPDLLVVIADPLRPGHELRYHPGEVNLRSADAVVINKEDTAKPSDIEKVRANVKAANPRAVIIDAGSPVEVADPSAVKGKRVLVVEDGPTVTHGGMGYGAGKMAAQQYGVKEMVNPRPYAVGSLARTFEEFKHLQNVLPAMGYSKEQLRELEATINAADCDVVLSGTPIDLTRIIKVNKPLVRVSYRLQERSKPDLEMLLTEMLKRKGLGVRG
jgi:predicted GTPase